MSGQRNASGKSPYSFYDIAEILTSWMGSQSAKISRLERQLFEISENMKSDYAELLGLTQMQAAAIQRLEASAHSKEKALGGLAKIAAQLHRVVTSQVTTRPEGGEQDQLLTQIKMILAETKDILVDLGLEPVPGIGADYSSVWHQVVEQRPGPQYMEGKVAEVIQPGYRKSGADLAVVKALVAIGVVEHEGGKS
jgi:molecular chaperone GrpE (heat shock protein)